MKSHHTLALALVVIGVASTLPTYIYGTALVAASMVVAWSVIAALSVYAGYACGRIDQDSKIAAHIKETFPDLGRAHVDGEVRGGEAASA